MPDKKPVDPVIQAERIEPAAATLFGDIRDEMIALLQGMDVPWPQISEPQRNGKIHHVETVAGEMVRAAIAVIAARGFESVAARLGKFTVHKGMIKGDFAAALVDGNLIALAGHQERIVQIVLADAEDFSGERQPDPDEPADDLPPESSAGDLPPHDADEADLYRRACEAVRSEGKASASFVQRALSIGYNRARALIERMERDGIVSPADAGRRTVIETEAEADQEQQT